ncbi:MAG: FAD-dependent oxidoreductase [Anaerolineae bacterium]|nr:FAD-dependent oxidoreductase [Gloeobacterales cyanobacterium ES-bin-313]
MSNLTGKHISYWIDSTDSGQFVTPESISLDGIAVDVVIVGAGITGLTTAWLLKKVGKTVAVLEANQVAGAASGHTTAKVTSLHQLIYADLINNLGQEKAQIYADSNQAGVKWIADLVEAENIDCDYKSIDVYTFAESDADLKKIEEEYEAAVRLGLPASFVKETTLPFPIAGAVKFSHQGEFHPRKYLLHLAQKISGEGSFLFEKVRVESIEEGQPCQVKTGNGTILAGDVIVTTNIPSVEKGLFFAKASAQRSYIVAAKIDPTQAPQGAYIGVGEGYRSLRTTPFQDGLLLLIGGEGHKVGTVNDTEACYQKLEAYGRSRFGITNFDFRWSNQDMKSYDKLPFIGKATDSSDHLYVATGYDLWGMSKGTMAAMILTDLVRGYANPWAELYTATRSTPFITPGSIKNNTETAVHWIGDRLQALQNTSFNDVGRGEAKRLTIDGKQVAAYRDEQGEIHAVSAVCTHLGCVVNWNNGEKSWDCPCHGARFSCEGKVLQGPAVKDLEGISSMARV